MSVEGVTHCVDMGFIVYDERNYPLVTGPFSELGVRTRPSDMRFAMADDAADVEWCGTSLRTVFSQPRNIVRPKFLRMLGDIRRFNRSARRFLNEPEDVDYTLEEFLEGGRYSPSFIEWYLVPMGAVIWSADPAEFLQFPAAAFIRFFDNHGLLGIRGRPQWRSVVGGSKQYVDAITAPLGEGLRLADVGTARRALRRGCRGHHRRGCRGVRSRDHGHSFRPGAEVLESPTALEREILSSIRYRANEATVHTDERLMPRRRHARELDLAPAPRPSRTISLDCRVWIPRVPCT